MKILINILVVSILSLNLSNVRSDTYSGSAPWANHGKLQVSTNGHYLVYEDGTPFFWLGDTGWEMLRRLGREEIETYLENRKSKGFNVIQTVIISEFIHSDKETNFYGDSVLINDDPLKPAVTPGNNPSDSKEYDYWDHIDFAVSAAEKKSMYVALVPTWGEWVIPRTDKAIFNTTGEAYAYGWFAGNRYKKSPNIIWILGGDRHPDERPQGVEIWRAMAEGIADGVNGVKKQDGKADFSTTFMTHHAYNSSSAWFHNDSWIDFHMWGSYHAEINNSRAYELALKDWNLTDPKPTINGEPCYEAHGINYAVDDNGYFTSTDVRLAAYWSAFSGSAGFTYGAQPIWQFTDASRKKHSKMTLTSWQEALDLTGAGQMQFLKELMEEAISSELKPDQSIIIEGEGSCSSRVCALRDKSSAYLYIPTGNQVKVRLGILDGKTIRASWLDPRTGEKAVIGEFHNSGEKVFDVPGMSKELTWLRSGRGCDWVLVLKCN
jgi:hypothetical protein